MKNEQIAQIAHEANRVVQIATGDPAVSPHWEDAPEWQRESAVEGIKQALAGATPEQLHQSWCDFKENDGWIYGETKDAESKTHPCLVSYSELPQEQRDKDTLFHAIVNTLSSLDFE